MRKYIGVLLSFGGLLLTLPAMAMEQYWIDDLNTRFPQLGREFQYAVRQKLVQYGEDITIETLIDTLQAHQDYSQETITTITEFGIHSDLLVLYPAVGQYEEALQTAKRLRDFVLKSSPDNKQVIVTFRGVYTELLIVNELYEEALRECEETLALAPDEEGIFLSRGVAYTHLGRLDDAFEELKILFKQPDSKNYAQQFFDFIMAKRYTFQEARVQRNTMIDVMLQELNSKQRTQIKIPLSITPDSASGQGVSSSPSVKDTNQPVESPLPPINALLHLDHSQLIQTLGQPLAESDEDTTVDREYDYNGRPLTITFNKQTQHIVSAQVFFLPPVDETEAFVQLGLSPQHTEPTIVTASLKVWSPYDDFSKIQLLLNEQKVIAIIIQP